MSDFFLQIRSIVILKKRPRSLVLNNNLQRLNESTIYPMTYPENLEGLILSFADRYPFTKKLYNEVVGVWNENKEHLRVKE